jgi:hypothetical protein
MVVECGGIAFRKSHKTQLASPGVSHYIPSKDVVADKINIY